MFSSTSRRRAFSWLLQYSSYTQNLSFCKTRTEPVGDRSRQEGRHSEMCGRLGQQAREERPTPHPDPETYPQGGISDEVAPTRYRPLSLHSCPSSAPSDLSGSSRAQGQVHRLKPGSLGLNPGCAFPAVNLGKLPDLSMPWFPHLLRWS